MSQNLSHHCNVFLYRYTSRDLNKADDIFTTNSSFTGRKALNFGIPLIGLGIEEQFFMYMAL
jgi:hypothetical protein